MTYKTLDDLGDIRGRRVLVREDLNAPSAEGKVTDDTRLRAGPDDRAHPAEPAGETLAQEPRQQPSHQPVFEMDLDHVGCIDAGLRIPRRLERNGPQRRLGAPSLQSFAPAAVADAKIVKRLLPAAVTKHRHGGIEPEQLGGAHFAGTGGSERGAGPA